MTKVLVFEEEIIKLCVEISQAKIALVKVKILETRVEIHSDDLEENDVNPKR